MKVLLLGATGNLGTRCLPALLAHGHTVVVYVRNLQKLNFLAGSVVSMITVVSGDATDSAGIKKALIDNDCDAIVNTAGNQVLPWREHLLPKIAKAVSDAAVEVGQMRRKPLRAWLIGGLGLLGYPGSEYQLEDYFPKIAGEQHHGTLSILEIVPVSSLHWSLLCVALMNPVYPTIEPLHAPRTHNLLVKAGSPPGWVDHWTRSIPLVGSYLNIVIGVSKSTTWLEDVADFMAEDLEKESQEWVGEKVGIKQRDKVG